MKSLLLSAIFFICSFQSISAQNISVSVGEGSSGATGSVFPLENGLLSVSANQVVLGESEFYMPFSWSVSPEGRKVSFLIKETQFTYKLFDSNGTSYFEKELEFFNLRDETAKNYQFDNGSSVLRDNVANFSFYSSEGEQLFSISNSSQSTEGEMQSELASDRSGKTIVLYNPVINYGSSTGSRASLVTKERELNTFFRDREREISKVEVTPSGTYISIIAKPAAGSDQYGVSIYDRFGNTIFELETDEEVKGAEITENADYVTIYSSGRMQVYEITDGERIGSASSRNSIIHAIYDPAENMIVAFGGSVNGYRVTNPSITAVHIGQRQIESEEINNRLSTMDADKIRIKKDGSQEYVIHHLDRSVRVNTSF